MKFSEFIYKVQDICRSLIISWFRKKPFYFTIYPCYWHYRLFYKPGKTKNDNYFTAIPNRGAGIGHQLANWNAGRWFANELSLKYAYSPFPSKSWDELLGFGQNEITARELIKKHRFKKVQLPLFDEFNSREVSMIKKIIHSYSNKNIVFIAEKDQGYRDQFGIIPLIQNKFFSATSRIHDNIIYNPEHFNIAVHVRRGDIAIGQVNNNPNLKARWQDNSYFSTVLNSVLNTIKKAIPVSIYLFSQGTKEDFQEFYQFNNIRYCLDMDAKKSFLHMVHSDLLITSKSSFSYKPALLCKGIKICPKKFWHGYPQTKDWILADDYGYFNRKKLLEIIDKHEQL